MFSWDITKCVLLFFRCYCFSYKWDCSRSFHQGKKCYWNSAIIFMTPFLLLTLLLWKTPLLWCIVSYSFNFHCPSRCASIYHFFFCKWRASHLLSSTLNAVWKQRRPASFYLWPPPTMSQVLNDATLLSRVPPKPSCTNSHCNLI